VLTHVVFRADGRVQHVACPPVTCSMCSTEIVPNTPIRRDGETLVHSTCWMRHFRQTSGITATPASELGELIRARLTARSVPSTPPSQVRTGVSHGATCAGCGGRIAVGVVEYEVQFADTVFVRFHRACYAMWNTERVASPRPIAGGSSASPWTLMFEQHIGRRAARDRDRHREFLLACVEVVSDVRRTHAFGRTTRARTDRLLTRRSAC
jgi:hypothetical protein